MGVVSRDRYRNRKRFVDDQRHRQQRAAPLGVYFQAEGNGRDDIPSPGIIPPPVGFGDQLHEEPRPVELPAILEGKIVIVRGKIESVRKQAGSRGPACADGQGDRGDGRQDLGEGNLRSP